MRYRQMRLAFRPNAFGPEEYVEIERSCLPWLATSGTAEMCFYLLQSPEQGRRDKRGCHNCRRICILPPRRPQGRTRDYGGLRKHVNVIHFERRNSLIEDLLRATDMGERLVRSQSNEVEIGQSRYPLPAGHRVAVGDRGKSPCSRDGRGPDPDRKWPPIFRFRRRPDRKRCRPIHWQ